MNSKFLFISIILISQIWNISCAKPVIVKSAQIEKEHESFGWIDEDTFQLRANGRTPEKNMDMATAKLLACENARNYGIKMFNHRFLKNNPFGADNPLYPEQKFTKQYHEYKIEIKTVYKENDPGGNCFLQLYFHGKDLKKKLSHMEDKSLPPVTPGWD